MDIILNQNEYYTGLVNFILFMRLYATNTSRKQKTIVDVFASETLEFGDKKAFPFAELPKVEDYSLTSSLLTDKPIKYSQEFIGEPIKKKISLSRIEPFAKMAMINSSGMAAFFAYILGLMESAKENYLYNEIMKDILSWTPSVSANKEMLQNISLINATGQSASEQNAARNFNQTNIALAWQRILDDFSIFTDVFLDIDNVTDNTNFKSAVNKDDLIFIGNARYLNEEVVSIMVQYLKSDLLNQEFRKPQTIKIPERTMRENGQENCIGFIVHKHWYQWFYHFLFMGSFFDVDTVRIKNVLHFWFSKGRLSNLPAVKLVAQYANG